MSDKPIKVLVVEPMQPCHVQEICGLSDMQNIVGGHIEATYPFREAAALVCNETGKIQGLPYNFHRRAWGRRFYFINRGTDSSI